MFFSHDGRFSLRSDSGPSVASGGNRWCLLLGSFFSQSSAEWERLLSRQRRKVLFVDASSMGILLALATPIDLPGRDVSFSYNFEANYALPSNLTQLLENDFTLVRRQRSLDRRSAYSLLEKRFEREGLTGRACVLRTVCEVAETPLRHNGLVGDLMHIFFTPSTSTEEGLPLEFSEAEERGRAGADCAAAYPACRHSPLDLVSVVI
ncbi:uncharacterized protein LOC126413235 [Schistocerca serialis cubense]|uniref:uncharacterized protein LOC126413235 n=1 Tax=Schistocerca serialis cubense TaxID=2023355 RepID=UPI00214F5B91|nr:uncharacterized protein LOC126413235 [Schistocerca serialis cubense]